jgi:hypothetical protein
MFASIVVVVGLEQFTRKKYRGRCSIETIDSECELFAWVAVTLPFISGPVIIPVPAAFTAVDRHRNNLNRYWISTGPPCLLFADSHEQAMDGLLINTAF